MKQFPIFVPFLLSALNIVQGSQDLSINEETKLLGEVGSDTECALYLAESSTSSADEFKWGLYSGVTIPPKSTVGAPEIAILTHNMVGNSQTEEDYNSDKETLALATVKFLEDFIWISDPTGGSRELGGSGRLVSAIPGVGVLGAYNIKLINADWDHRGAFHRTRLQGANEFGAHPGRGASSHFYNVTLRSTDKILAGAEIFINYGEAWGEEEDDDDEESELNKKDFEKVDEFVNQMIDFFSKYEGELTQLAKSEIYDFLVKDVVLAAAGEKKGNTIFKMLPKHPDELINIKEAGGALKYSLPSSKRNLEWLKENGMCMDNIYMDASNIPFAGRGAFARRHIPEGGIVTPVPLIQIPDKSVMDMYEVKQSSDSEGKTFFHRNSNEPTGKQLLLNYCYGHPESSLLFFPSGSLSVMINHSVEKANVKLRFSDHRYNRKEWWETPPKELIDDDHPFLGLLMEIVALRDIKQGEELLMDYGQEWQLAWDAHVQKWNAALEQGELSNVWPRRALDLSQEYVSKPYPTEEEGVIYPENVVQMCFLVVKKGQDENTTSHWAVPPKESVFDSNNLFECKVTERFELEKLDDFGSTMPFNYTVEWYTEKGGKDHGTQVLNVPHAAITFIDKPMTSDQFVAKAFRHEIGIPDDVFPQGPWRNQGSKIVSKDEVTLPA